VTYFYRYLKGTFKVEIKPKKIIMKYCKDIGHGELKNLMLKFFLQIFLGLHIVKKNLMFFLQKKFWLTFLKEINVNELLQCFHHVPIHISK
jgi:hypothetical protein